MKSGPEPIYKAYNIKMRYADLDPSDWLEYIKWPIRMRWHKFRPKFRI